MPVNRTDRSPAHHKQAMRVAQKKLDELYKSLGVRTYACMKERELGLPELELIKNEIDETMRALNDSGAEIERIKATKQVARGASCPQCGMKTPAGSVVCPYCGMTILVQAEAAPAAAEIVELIVCPHCQGEITADAAWCGLCGKQVFEQADEAPGGPVPAVSVEQAGSEAAAQSVDAPPGPEEVIELTPAPRFVSGPSADSGNFAAIGDKLVSLEPAVVRDEPPAIKHPIEQVSERPLSDTSLRGAPKPPPAPEPVPVEPAVVAQKKCLACGEVQRREAAFCFNCGERL